MAKLIIITGLPATGKSTIARHLAKRLSLPLISKDVYKEMLFESLGVKDRAWSRLVGRAAFDLLYHELDGHLRTGHSVIVEANFKAEKDNERMTKIVSTHHPDIVQILCRANGEVVLQRFCDRIGNDRHPGHCDAETLEELRPALLQGRAEPLMLPGRLVEVDTTVWSESTFEKLETELSL